MGRVISTALQFVDGFTKPSKAAINSIKKLGREIAGTGKQIQNVGKTITTTGSTLTKAITLPITGIATAAVKTAANFETSMSQVAATMGKTKDEVKGLSELAQQMGATTAFSASEAAEGINILAMAGLNATQIGESLGTVLDLAAAGAMDMGSSASYVVGAVKGFKDEMGNAAKYADLMAKGATLANTDVAALGEAISYGAATASGYSQSVDSMTLSLLRMAEQNVTGQTAATSLNRAMADLYSPTTEAKKALDSLGISAYNADGSARDFNIVVDELSSALKSMSKESANALKSTIFTTNGMNAFNKMTASTSARVKELQEGLGEASGSAAEQAKTQLDNLNGQITLLKSAIEAIAITIGNKLLPYMTKAVEWMQKAADYINNLSDAQVDSIMRWTSMAAVIGPIILAFGKVVTTIGTVTTKYGVFVKKIGDFKGIAKMITNPAGIVIGVLAGIAAAAILIIKNWDKIQSFLSRVGNWFKSTFDHIGFSVDRFQNKFSSIGNSIGNIAGKIGEFCKSVADIFKNKFSAIITEEATGINQGFESILFSAGVVFDGIFTAVDIGIKALSGLVDFFDGAFRGDWENATQGVRDSLKNIFPETIANGLITAFEKTLPFIKGAVEGVRGVFRGLIQDVKLIFANVTSVFSGIGTFFQGIFTGDIETALGGLKTAVGSAVDVVANGFRIKITVIKNFVLGALSNFFPQETVNKIAKAFDAVAAGWSVAIKVAKDLANDLIDGIRPLFQNIKTILSGMLQFVKGIFTRDWSSALEGLKTVASGALSGLVNMIKAPFSAIVNLIKGVIQDFKGFEIVKKVFSSAGNIIKDMLNKSGINLNQFGTTINQIKTRVGNIVQNLKTIFKVAFGAIGTAVKVAANVVTSIFGKKISDAGETVATFRVIIGTAFQAISSAIQAAMGVVVPVIKVAFSSIKSVISVAIYTVTNLLNGFLTILDGITTFVSGVFTGNWSKAWEGIKTIFKGVFESFEALCKVPLNGVISLINNAISGINNLGLTIPEWIPVIGGKSFSINIPTIPMLYKGTNNWQGGAAMIHDRGGEIVDLPKGSRVYPHDKSVEMARKEGAKQNGSITVNIQKLADKIEVRKKEDIDRIAEALARKLKQVAFNTGIV